MKLTLRWFLSTNNLGLYCVFLIKDTNLSEGEGFKRWEECSKEDAIKRFNDVEAILLLSGWVIEQPSHKYAGSGQEIVFAHAA